jgi:hypothetical protein
MTSCNHIALGVTCFELVRGAGLRKRSSQRGKRGCRETLPLTATVIHVL